MSRARDLSKLSSPSNFTVDTNNNIGVNSTTPDAKFDVVGVVSATKYFGDGSELTGITAGGLSGAPDITIGNITGVAATFTGDMSVRNITGVAATFTGVLTYEDVTNIDSIGIITARSHVSIADSILHTGDTNTSIRFPAADTFTVETAGTERVRIDSSGRSLINTTESNGSALLKVNGSTSGTTAGGDIALTQGRDAPPNGSTHGVLRFGSHNNINGATIVGYADGAWSAGSDHPSGIIINTTPSSSTSPTERLRITSDGNVRVPDNGKFTCGAGDDLQIYHDGTTNIITGDSSGDNISIRPITGENGLLIAPNGAVTLYHNDSAKLATTSSGVDVTGTVTMDAVAGTNTNAYLNVLFQTSAGTIDGGSGLTYNPGEDSLSVNGNFINLNTFRGAGNAGTLNCANGAGNYDVRTSSTNVLLVSGGTTRVDAFATGVKLGPGVLIEDGNIDTTARTGTQNTNLDAGMVVYYSTASTNTWKPNFRVSSSVSLNSVMSDGDVISPTTIVAKGATSHYADTIQVDGSDVTPEWLGGAPTDGGGSGTFDTYSYTIIKTGNAAFKAFGSVSNYE